MVCSVIGVLEPVGQTVLRGEKGFSQHLILVVGVPACFFLSDQHQQRAVMSGSCEQLSCFFCVATPSFAAVFWRAKVFAVSQLSEPFKHGCFDARLLSVESRPLSWLLALM